MKIRIEEELFEGTPAQILDILWQDSFDKQQFNDLERYIDWMADNYERMTDMPCKLRSGSLDEKAHRLITALAEIDALEVIDDE